MPRGGWNQLSEQLLFDWNHLIQTAIDEHKKPLTPLKRWNFFYVILVNVKEVSVTTVLINLLTNDFGPELVFNLLLALAIVVATVGVIQGVQSTLDPVNIAHRHKEAMTEYLRLFRDIESILALPKKQRDNAPDTLKTISKRIGKIMEEAPDIPVYKNLGKQLNIEPIKKRKSNKINGILTEPTLNPINPTPSTSTKLPIDPNLQWQLDRMEADT